MDHPSQIGCTAGLNSPTMPRRGRPAASSFLVNMMALAVLVGMAIDLRPFLQPVDPASQAVERLKIEGRIDPKQAPWWEWASLPGIGEVRAKAIVAYREQTRAGQPSDREARSFIVPADLEKVLGIGPQTVEDVQAYVRWPTADGGADNRAAKIRTGPP